MRVTWTARKSNQSVLKEINPEYSLENKPSCSTEKNLRDKKLIKENNYKIVEVTMTDLEWLCGELGNKQNINLDFD